MLAMHQDIHGELSLETRELLYKMASKERRVRGRNFVAPYIKGSKTAIVQIDKLMYRFKIEGIQGNGIGLFRPVNALIAKYVGEAEFEHRQRFLSALPSIELILSYQIDDGWVCIPAHKNTTKQLGGSQEVIVFGVQDAQRFDVVTARSDGYNLWYDDLSAASDPIVADNMREQFEELAKRTFSPKDVEMRVRNATPECHEAFRLAAQSWVKFRKTTTEDRVRELLRNGGARLGSFIARGQELEIIWQSESGVQYQSVVDRDSLDVVTAGICLDGEDDKFHLKDLPHLVSLGENTGSIYRTLRPRNISWPEEE